MKGDFSRIPFDPGANISRVLFHQGRPLVEADMNEALLALLENQRTITHLQVGYAKPFGAINGFKAGRDAANKLIVEPGGYHALGTLLLNPAKIEEPSYRKLDSGQYLIAADKPTDDQPGINEVFLLALLASERPLMLSEIADRTYGGIEELNASLPWRIEHHLILEPVVDANGDGTIDNAEINMVKNSLLQKNPFGTDDSLTPKKEKTAPSVIVSARAGSRSQLPETLYRLEIHSVEEDENREVIRAHFKLAADNASRVFRLSKTANGAEARIIPSQGRLPSRGAVIELEKRHRLPDLAVSGPLHTITSLIEYRDGILASGLPFTTAIAQNEENTRVGPDQVRAWNAEKSVEIKDDVVGSRKGFQIGDVFVRFTSTDTSIIKQQLRAGDGWTFHSSAIATEPEPVDEGDAAAVAAKLEVIRKFPTNEGTRRRIFYLPLASIKFIDGNGSIEDPTPVSLSGLTPPSPALVAKTLSPSVPANATGIDLARAAFCRQLFPEVENLAARRWLASATLGEISELSKEQLRTVIQRDCSSNEIDSATLDQDLEVILAKRRQILPSTLV